MNQDEKHLKNHWQKEKKKKALYKETALDKAASNIK